MKLVEKKNQLVGEENQLFNKWKQELQDNNFIKDGIIDEEKFLSSDVKLVFVLKETNSSVNQEKDLRIFLKNDATNNGKKAKGATWNNIARWTMGIQQIKNNKKIKFENVEEEIKTNRVKYLNKICVMNLKKTCGSSTAKQNSIKEATKNNKDFLKEQFKLYKEHVDIVICCGIEVGDNFLEAIFNDGRQIEWEKTSNKSSNIKYFKPETEKFIIINYVHPAARQSKNKLYTNLINGLEEILQQNNNV